MVSPLFMGLKKSTEGPGIHPFIKDRVEKLAYFLVDLEPLAVAAQMCKALVQFPFSLSAAMNHIDKRYQPALRTHYRALCWNADR